MNVLKACEILELPENYNAELLKKNYRSLAMKYHPDKNKESDTTAHFAEINAAHDFLSNKPVNIFEKVNVNVFENLFKNFTTFHFQPTTRKITELSLTAKEYLTGSIKKIKTNCNCQLKTCKGCSGCGISFHGICETCMGEGYTQDCLKCENGLIFVDISIPPKTNHFFHPLVGEIKLNLENPYFLKENGLYCYFDISLKESLTGFNKIFKDPFDVNHDIIVNSIIKSNDGFRLNKSIVLVFNVIYPKKLNAAVIEQLKNINF